MKKIFRSLFRPQSQWGRWAGIVLIVAIAAGAMHSSFDPLRQQIDTAPFVFTLGSYELSLYGALKGLFVVFVFFWLANLVVSAGEKWLRNLNRLGPSNKALLIKGFQIGTYMLAFLLVLDVLGTDLTAFAVVGGAIGIGVGFGLQKITSNFISGLILLFEKSVEEGDLVELSDGTAGFVRHTGARYTLIETFESRDIMVPNEDFITNRVTNWTFSNSQGRIDINIGVSYGADLDKAHQLIVEAAREHPRCSEKPGPECFLMDFGDSSINFVLHFWVDDIIAGRRRPRSDVLFSIWRKFKEAGIEIPFPQRDIHVKTSLPLSGAMATSDMTPSSLSNTVPGDDK
ncbi:MAG: mechanosensitive ion channel protein MscS [Kordiimonas sp.]|nr:mechanosensitive ion channel protein MscS [Kordiimonas sp.]|tara:strand:+ start:2139 stop:3167 length:1029 start_codon:yes stop_codon:yes gene_type:complete